jgi:hypothetical protein
MVVVQKNLLQATQTIPSLAELRAKILFKTRGWIESPILVHILQKVRKDEIIDPINEAASGRHQTYFNVKPLMKVLSR